jgi:hypothetical protein
VSVFFILFSPIFLFGLLLKWLGLSQVLWLLLTRLVFPYPIFSLFYMAFVPGFDSMTTSCVVV